MNFISKQELNSCHCTNIRRSKYMTPTIQSNNIEVLGDHSKKIVARSNYVAMLCQDNGNRPFMTELMSTKQS